MDLPRTLLTREDLPAKRAHRFGLKSVTPATQRPNGPWMGGGSWEESCGNNVFVAPDNCDPLLEAEDLEKVSFAIDGGTTDDLTLYAYHRCSIIGTALSEHQRYAAEELDLGEWQQIEKRLMERIVADGETNHVTGISGAKNALAALLMEWDLPVEPTIHVTPNVAVGLEGQFKREANHLELTIGGPVSVGYGYNTGLADATEGYIALTGPTFATFGTSRDLTGNTVDVASNTALGLVERPFQIGYLCRALWVQVNDVNAITA